MPSISQRRLDEMTEVVTVAEGRMKRAEEDAVILRRQVMAFDSILDKIERAANGQSLAENNNPAWHGGPPRLGDIPSDRLTDAERQQMELDHLHGRIVRLEVCLAGVKAIAQFAKGHKA